MQLLLDRNSHLSIACRSSQPEFLPRFEYLLEGVEEIDASILSSPVFSAYSAQAFRIKSNEIWLRRAKIIILR